MRRQLVIPVLLSLVVMACSLTPPTEVPLAYTGLGMDALGSYRAVFELHFEGDSAWSYRLETAASGDAVEYLLHMDGVSVAQNPGDVRLVIEGDVARMRGQGTEDECILFPSDLDLGFSLLTPDDLIAPDHIGESLDPAGSETIAGLDATHYLAEPNTDKWDQADVEIWLADKSGAVVRYDLTVTGSDPLFDGGEGTLTGQLLVSETSQQTIVPIQGCEINLPLPTGAARLIRLPGLIAFESTFTSAEMVAFYQDALVVDGWEAAGEPERGDDAVLLSYRRDAETLAVNIELDDGGVQVELLLGR